MKRTIQITVLAFLSFTMQAQEEVSISMGSNYTDRVFYQLSEDQTDSYTANDWDIAFYRLSNYEFAVRINDGKGIRVYEAANTPSDWETIDLSNSGSWTELYNSEETWLTGAFNNGSATYGWGEYNSATHHVEGTIVFVLEYANGNYKKFFIESFYGEYTFKYSSWNGSSWSADQTYSINNSTNQNKIFNYFSLENETEVIAEPNTDSWDLVFTKYISDLGGGVMYSVTGVLHHPDIEVAKHDETQGAANIETLEYLSEINTIGRDWKSFTGSEYIVDSDMGYYIKDQNNQVYRVVFTEFEGASTGNVTFEVTEMGQLNTTNFEKGTGFSIYPNPSQNKKVDVLLDIKNSSADNSRLNIYSILGENVFEDTFKNTSGLSQKTLNLSHLKTGVYLVNVNIGSQSFTQKLILK